MTPNPPPPPGPQMPPPPPPPGAPAAPKTSGLAIAALIVSIVGLCVPCLGPVTAVILAIVALTTMGKKGQTGQGLAIAALVIAVGLGVVGTGIMAAIAVPNFVKFQARAKQNECKSNLKAAFTAQRSFFQEKDRYSESASEIGFWPERPMRYSYFLSPQGPYARAGETLSAEHHGFLEDSAAIDAPPDIGAMQIGVDGECPECDFTASCAGNLDQDPTLDVWVVSSTDLQLENGEIAPAGVPHQVVDDTTE